MSGMSRMQRPPLVSSLTCRRKFRYSRVDLKATRLHPPHQQSAQHFSRRATSKLPTPTWMPSSRRGEPSSGARVWRNSPGLREDTEVRERKQEVHLLGSELTLGLPLSPLYLDYNRDVLGNILGTKLKPKCQG